MKIRRREFIHRTALGVGGLVVARPQIARAQAPAAHFDPYALVRLGNTSLKVSRVCLGTGMSGSMRSSNHTRMGKQALGTLIRESFERGTRLYDLADLYGTSGRSDADRRPGRYGDRGGARAAGRLRARAGPTRLDVLGLG